jgi:hypothetical protein
MFTHKPGKQPDPAEAGLAVRQMSLDVFLGRLIQSPVNESRDLMIVRAEGRARTEPNSGPLQQSYKALPIHISLYSSCLFCHWYTMHGR